MAHETNLPDPTPTPSPHLAAFLPLLAAATLLAAALRLHNLETGSFWLDELYTVRSLQHLDTGSFQWTKVLGYIPWYISLLLAGVDPSSLDPTDASGWRAAGVTELSVRLPSAIIGIVTIPLLALPSRRLLGDRGAILAAFLLAVSPWHIYWSQAGRFYIFQFLLYSLALVLYFTATRPFLSRPRFLLALTVAVLAFMSQPTAVVLGVVFAADWLYGLTRRHAGEDIRLGAFGWAASIGALAVCVLLFASDALRGNDGISTAIQDEVIQTPKGVIAASAYLIWPSVAAFTALAGLWLWNADRRLAVYFGAAATFPILLFAALAAVYPVGSRYAFVCAFAWIVIASAALDRTWTLLRPRAGLPLAAAPAAALLTGSLIAAALAHSSGGNMHARWADAVRAMQPLRAPGEPVYAGEPYIAAYYLGESVRPLPGTHEEINALPHPAWVIVDSTARRGTRRHPIAKDAELIDYFGLRAAHTASSVQIYRHTPRDPLQPPS